MTKLERKLRRLGLWEAFLSNVTNPQWPELDGVMDAFALLMAFRWGDSPEGDRFWRKVYFEL